MNHSAHDHHVMDSIMTSDHSLHMDHTSHGAHNMDHMDHMSAPNQHHQGMMMHMEMYFHFGYNETILFSFWKTTSIEGFVGSVIAIFILALLYEGLKYLREFLFWKHYSSLQYRTVQGPATAKTNSEPTTARVVNLVPDVSYKWMPSLLSTHHILQTFLHIIQVFVSYLLMLIFMTYNVWLCIAIVVGAATGYFFFGWKKALFVDVTEHCH